MAQRRAVQRQEGSRAARGSPSTVQCLRLSVLGRSQDLQTASLQAVPEDWLRVTLKSELGTVGAGGMALREKPQELQCQSWDTSKDTAVMGDHAEAGIPQNEEQQRKISKKQIPAEKRPPMHME